MVSESKPSGKLKRALIVSNDEDLSLLLSFLLKAEAVQVKSSKTLQLAIPITEKEQPNAIFLDLDDGKAWMLLELIQQHWPHISLFTVVKPEFRSLAEKSLQSGAKGYLMTPVDYRGVQRILDSRTGAGKQRLGSSRRSTSALLMTR